MHAQPETERNAKRAMLRGWRRRCPNCGAGPIMRGYLQVRDTCPVCQQELLHHRADDGPAYLTILITGHIVVPFLHFGFKLSSQPIVVASALSVGALTLSLYLLPRIKGAIVGLQWAKRMHGFAKA